MDTNQLIKGVDKLIGIFSNPEEYGFDAIELHNLLNAHWDNGSGLIIKSVDYPELVHLGHVLAERAVKEITIENVNAIKMLLATKVFITQPKMVTNVEIREVHGYHPNLRLVLKNILILMLAYIKRCQTSPHSRELEIEVDQLMLLMKINIIDKLETLLSSKS